MTWGGYPQLEPEWVDEVLPAGAAGDVCLALGESAGRAELPRLVTERHRTLAGAWPAAQRHNDYVHYEHD